jgi:Icc-related predicted phosphoesterase
MAKTLTIFYASDIHGSEKVFRKFLNAAPFYKADVVIFGGDLTGKSLVPIVEVGPGRFQAKAAGVEGEITGGEALDELEARIRGRGSYPYRTTPEELAEMNADPAKVREIFHRVMHVHAERWITLADERLRAAGIPALMMPGNDDEPEVKRLIAQGEWITDAEGRCVELEGYQVISWGYATTTPWHSPREVTEQDMATALDRLVAELDLNRPVIFNFHDPPRESGLDMAYKMTPDMRVQMTGGQAALAPVGSVSVRQTIERVQPVLSLHGHIHESRAIGKVGRSVAINPGSSYADGMLQGVLVTLRGGKVVGQQLVTG